MNNPFYRTYRDWDCFLDCPGDMVTFQLGFHWKKYFFGLSWHSYIAFTGDNDKYM